jgi:hypothetical protein
MDFKQTYCSGRSQRPIAVPVLGTPDSRVTTFETTLTTKSIGTIPEDTEESQSSSGCGLVLLPSPLSLLATSTDHHHRKENGYADSDLISIDRVCCCYCITHMIVQNFYQLYQFLNRILSQMSSYFLLRHHYRYSIVTSAVVVVRTIILLLMSHLLHHDHIISMVHRCQL